MVKTIADMAANFGFSVIAEGVETVGQLQFLESNKCHAYQGYLFSKPLPLEAFLEILKTKEYLSKVTSDFELS